MDCFERLVDSTLWEDSDDSIVSEVFKIGAPIFLFMILIILVHMLVAYGLGWLMRLDLPTITVASAAAPIFTRLLPISIAISIRCGSFFSAYRAFAPRRFSLASPSARPFDKETSAVSDPEKNAESARSKTKAIRSPTGGQSQLLVQTGRGVRISGHSYQHWP